MVLLEKQKDRWSNVETYYYAVLVTREGLPSILYRYVGLKEEELKEFKESFKKGKVKQRKPNSYSFTDAKEASQVESTQYSYGAQKYNFKELKTTPEEEGLYIPTFYNRSDFELKITKDEYITDDMLGKIRKLEFANPIVIIGQDPNIAKSKLNVDATYEYYCTSCGISYFGKNRCPKCGKSIYNNTIVMSNFKNHIKEQFNIKTYSPINIHEPSNMRDRIYYMKSVENGIVLYKICRNFKAENNVIAEDYCVEYSLEHIVGKSMIAYKHLKRGKKECDPFEALNINTKNIRNVPTIIYEDAADFFEFAANNEKFLRMSGFQTVLKYSGMKLELESFFIVFLGIINKYPIMEQIVKMGHSRLFFILYNNMLNCLNKDEINRNVERISQLVDNEATKGKDALRFPLYIGDYLIKKDASLEEYYYWRDLFEITHITKEQFENFTESFNFAWVNSQSSMEDIGNILKFGYSLDKLFNYIVKQSRVKNISVPTVITNLTDYLNMCDICGIEADKYPQDVVKQHDDIIKYFRQKERAEYDRKLQVIGNECEKYVIPDEDELKNVGIPKLFEKMTVIFPKSEADFIDEGNQQHNCVGSYPRNVRNGNCVIFFIRYKDTPHKSFITAECTKGGLGQCFYSNNRPVHDEELIKFARYIANKIKSGCNSGKIHGLHNI